MKNDDFLFDVIQSLSKSEKRFFKLFAERKNPSGMSKYLELFDVYAAAQSGAEAKRLTGLKAAWKNLRQIKHYLADTLLTALNNYHTPSDNRLQMLSWIQSAQILHRRGLLPNAMAILHKAHTRSKQLNSGVYRLLVLLEMMDIVEHSTTEPRAQVEKVQALQTEMSECLDLIRSYVDYQAVYANISALNQLRGKPRTASERAEFAEAIDVPAMKTESYLLNESTELYYYDANRIYYTAISEYRTAREYAERLIELFERAKILQFNYVPALLMLAQAHLGLNDFQRFHTTADKTEALVAQHARPSDIGGHPGLVTLLKIFRLQAYVKAGRFEEAIDYELTLRPEVKDLNKESDWGAIVLFYYYGAYAFFGAQRYSDAFASLELILEDDRFEQRPDVYTLALILNLILHVELGNIAVLEYVLRSAAKILRARQKAYETEEIMMEFIGALAQQVTQADVDELLQTTRMRLAELQSDPHEEEHLCMFDLIAWFDSKILRRPFAELQRKRANERYQKLNATSEQGSI